MLMTNIFHIKILTDIKLLVTANLFFLIHFIASRENVLILKLLGIFNYETKKGMIQEDWHVSC